MRPGWLLLGLLLAASMTGQEESETYFALTANRTFGPGETPRISLWAHGLSSLSFRLYRVENAGEFLGQLRDAHGFGHDTVQLPKEDTLLLKFARWKRQWRTRGQLYVRSQFTPAARASWHGRSAQTPPKTKPLAKGTAYAEIPLLNEKQLVRTWKENITGRERWEEQTVDVPIAESGLYLVEATDGKLRAYTLVSVSAMAVLTKTQPGQTLARVVDRASGGPLAGVEVEVRSQRQLHATLKTDATGFIRWQGTSPNDVFIVARRGREVAFDALDEYMVNGDAERRLTVYAYTDRPVYRPGHKVHYKAVLRKPVKFGYELPEASWVHAEILDGEGKTVHREELQLSGFGSVKGEFDLPVTASLGYYNVKFTSGRAESYASFQVEEYKKPEYEVKIRPAKPRVVQGERVEAVVAARYFFGEPVRGAKVTYTVRRAPYYPPWHEAEEGYEQTEPEEDGGEYFGGEQGEEQTGKLNEKGELAISLPTPVAARDYLFRIEARVMDEGNREVTGYGLLIATRGNYSVSVRPEKYVYGAGEAGNFAIETKDYDGGAVSADWRAELRRVEWREKRQEGPVLANVAGHTGIDGRARATLSMPGAGTYLVRVTSRTAGGRDLTEETYAWVSGSGSIEGDGEISLKLVPDKKKYAPGDTARVLILTPEAPAELWLTTESRGVIDSRAVRATSPGGLTIDVPIRGEFQPRVFVAASFVKNGRLYEGSATLRVPPVERELAVEIRSAKAEYKPGEPVRYDVQVKDHQGRGVRTELSLGVVDEALYAVKRDLTQTPLSFFYGNTYNEVNNSNSLTYYFRGEAGKRAMRLAQIRPSLGQLKPDNVGDPRVRKAFPDTAFWVADLVTDEQGRGQVNFSFPDALTLWRGTARAVSADTRVGAAVHRVTVRKNLLLRPVTPRFLMEGDEVSLGIVVQNYLASAKQVKLSLDATQVTLLDAREKTVTVDPKGTAKVEWRVRVLPGVESVLTAKGLTNEESDAIELTLPVKSYGTLLTRGASGVTLPGETAQTSLAAPGGGRRLVAVQMSPSLAGSLLGALEFLSTFPYGCTEQTLSSFLPNVIITRTLAELGIPSRLRREDLREKVTAGLERLYAYQHDDGAWGWWKNDASHPFMTAHVIDGLKQARAAGYPVVPEVLAKGEQWLRREFNAQRGARVDLQAYLAYALGTKPEIDSVWSQRDKLSSYGLAFLGLGLNQIRDARTAEIAERLVKLAVVEAGEASWPGERDPLLDFPVDITPETTAHVLKFLTRARPDSPLLAQASAWLVRHRDQGQWWNSTKQTAMVIYGVTDYLKLSGELQPDFQATVLVNGKVALERQFRPADALRLQDVAVEVPAADLNQVEVRMTGKGKLYWNAQTRYYSPADNLGAGNRQVKREYFRLVPRESAGVTTYSLEPLTGEIRPGDTIAGLVSVRAPDLQYVLIEEPLPAGMEPVTTEASFNLAGRPLWWRYSWAQREYRDDRVAFFRSWLGREEEQFFYVMKAVNPGQFRVPPTRVQPMYKPEDLTTGQATRLEVLP